MTSARDVASATRLYRLGPALQARFYDRDTAQVARDMLGAVLQATTSRGVTRGRIVETEAYLGPDDPACHAAAGLTARTLHLFGSPGRAYVYFVYGMHWCFNAVTRERGHGAAVLVRAVNPSEGIDLMRERRPHVRHERDLTNGPGKLCMAMGIDGSISGTSLRDGHIVIRAGESVTDADVVVTPRIGIRKAADWPLRFLVRNDPFVSATPAHFSRAAYST